MYQPPIGLFFSKVCCRMYDVSNHAKTVYCRTIAQINIFTAKAINCLKQHCCSLWNNGITKGCEFKLQHRTFCSLLKTTVTRQTQQSECAVSSSTYLESQFENLESAVIKKQRHDGRSHWRQDRQRSGVVTCCQTMTKYIAVISIPSLNFVVWSRATKQVSKKFCL